MPWKRAEKVGGWVARSSFPTLKTDVLVVVSPLLFRQMRRIDVAHRLPLTRSPESLLRLLPTHHPIIIFDASVVIGAAVVHPLPTAHLLHFPREPLRTTADLLIVNDDELSSLGVVKRGGG